MADGPQGVLNCAEDGIQQVRKACADYLSHLDDGIAEAKRLADLSASNPFGSCADGTKAFSLVQTKLEDPSAGLLATLQGERDAVSHLLDGYEAFHSTAVAQDESSAVSLASPAEAAGAQ